MNQLNSIIIEGKCISVDFNTKDTAVLKMDTVRFSNINGNKKEEHTVFYTEAYGALAEHLAKFPVLERTIRTVGRLSQYTFNKGLYVVAEHVEIKN